MSLSLRAPIHERDIHTVHPPRDKHPVYKLEGNEAGNALMIKLESSNGTRSNIKSNAMIMHAVSPSATSIPLQSDEVRALAAWCILNMLSPGAIALAQDLNHPGTWIKMKFANNLLNLQDAGNHALAGKKDDVRTMARVLNAPGGLESLGAIIAADAFIANNDRFAFDGQGGMEWHGTRLECLANVGNVFVATDKNGELKPIGLDTWDPGSQHNNLREELSEAMARWPGRMLANNAGQEREDFAEMVVSDLETVLGPRNRNLIAKSIYGTNRLGEDAVDRAVAGMETGAARIRNYLKQRYGAKSGQRLPAGLAQRLNVLGWFNLTDFPKLG